MSKTALSAKIEDSLLEETDRLTRLLKIPRNRAIEEGIRLWVNLKSREILAAKMKEASLATRNESVKEANDWAVALRDGLSREKS